MRELRALVARWGVSRREAARRLGVAQPRLNNLLRDRIDRFSLDALVNLLATGGVEVTVTTQRAA
jgi:predicted XRE-type DNA-binding protein